ncbi:DNA-directed RNA polymerase sigma-70 factor [Catellatospora methionotrophica]|uniref:DNA-directed RNA polymerase sigma-70 factor n=1 Tax=Catellatospora methionotrophica TaxID=121620 RepID=A0A8J3PGL6_9ACTN|nr:SigE family RNA polymerase sigma factor [Catellatospora methionotrophica]GIG14426.1 DNA-directed RNA polymerase sigma-70 factor [Catellatospora methionotrophica]
MDDGFDEYVQAGLGRWSRVAYLLTGDHHAAEDLLQNALLKLALSWRKARIDAPDAYLRKILYHEHVSRWRRSHHLRNEHLSERMPEHGTGHDLAADAIRRILLRQALEKLTRKQRAVIVLRYFEDLSEPDAAEALGVSIGTVKSQQSRALARLREVAPELHVLVKEPRGARA